MSGSTDPGRRFWRAVSHGNAGVARELLQAGVDPDTPSAQPGKDGYAYRPLMCAAAYGDLTMIRLLLDAGADVEGCVQSDTPLLSAALCGQDGAYRLLLEHGARETIWTAAACGDEDTVRRLHATDSEACNARNEAGATLLHVAALMHHVPVCRYLLEHGGDTHAVDRMRATAVHWACNNRAPDACAQIDTLRLLHEHGSDIDAANRSGVRPLHVAVRARSLEAVRFLVQCGVDVDPRDTGRKSTPLRRAVTNTGAGGTSGRTDVALEIAELLLEHGADPRATDAKGRTILEAARTPAMRELVESYL